MRRYVKVVLVLFILSILVGCSTDIKSDDEKFIAVRVLGDYEVKRVDTEEVIFTTSNKYSDPNPVKSAAFDDTSSLFAAAYHYGDGGMYTWIGLWSTSTGEFLYSFEVPGWIQDVSTIF